MVFGFAPRSASFRRHGSDSAWTIDLTTPPGTVTEGVAGKAVCTLEMSDADFMQMATGQPDAMKLLSTGKLKISGDVMASQKAPTHRRRRSLLRHAEPTLQVTHGTPTPGPTAAAPDDYPREKVPV